MAWKEVYFDKYCKSCVNKDTAEEKKPCKWCLNDPQNWDSHRPTRYKKDEYSKEELLADD